MKKLENPKTFNKKDMDFIEKINPVLVEMSKRGIKVDYDGGRVRVYGWSKKFMDGFPKTQEIFYDKTIDDIYCWYKGIVYRTGAQPIDEWEGVQG